APAAPTATRPPGRRPDRGPGETPAPSAASAGTTNRISVGASRRSAAGRPPTTTVIPDANPVPERRTTVPGGPASGDSPPTAIGSAPAGAARTTIAIARPALTGTGSSASGSPPSPRRRP